MSASLLVITLCVRYGIKSTEFKGATLTQFRWWELGVRGARLSHLQVASSHRPHLPFFIFPLELVEVAHHLNDSSFLSPESDGKRRSLVQSVYSLSLNVKGNMHWLPSAAQSVVAV